MQEALRAGRSLVILPEGTRGALGAHPRALMHKRRGYIRVVQEARAPKPIVFVPLYLRHDVPSYDSVPCAPRLQLWCLRWLRYPWPSLHWGWAYSFLPRRQHIDFIMYDPIDGARPEEEVHAAIKAQV
jgi:1-acyl-sn-glycerol-3-phosphate acyltransferase